MMKVLAAFVLSLGLVAPLACGAAETIARFDGGIGAQPLRAGGLVNDVNNVPPGGRPWVIERLTADVRANGRISVHGRGLILAGGANIGTGGGQSVRARLFCGGVPHDTPTLVPLDTDGDFRIEDVLVPNPPAVCANPVLLIVSGGGNWFAAGIPKSR
jgi:hypothetical protein